MMHLFRWISRPVLYLWYYAQKMLKTGSFGPDSPQYLTRAYENTGNVIKDALNRYHVKQFHESSCSVASVACVVNALLEKQGRAPDVPVTQQDLLEKVRAAHWKERMSDGGYNGRRGLPLAVLGEVVTDSLRKFDIQFRGVEIIQAARESAAAKKIKAQLRSRLTRFEKQGDCLVIAHFDQGSLIPEFHIPHISPVGGFDAAADTVTMLDVDPEQVHPYRVSFNRFYDGISTDYHHLFRFYGYTSGGYVFIRI